jgi:hypothetical protein
VKNPAEAAGCQWSCRKFLVTRRRQASIIFSVIGVDVVDLISTIRRQILAAIFLAVAILLAGPVGAQQSSGLPRSRSARIQIEYSPPSDLVAVDGAQVPVYAAWFSLANYAGAPCPDYGYFRQLYPDLPIYWSAATQTYWVDDTSLYAQQQSVASSLALFKPMDDSGSGGGGQTTPAFSTNSLWLEMVDGSVTTNAASFVVHSPQPGIFDLFYTTNCRATAPSRYPASFMI